MPRYFWNGLTGGAIVVSLGILAHLLLTPDPGAAFFARAQELENKGLDQSALRAYQLLSTNHPESFYAPRALLREGDLWASMGRQGSKKQLFQNAVAAYAKLAKNYPQDSLATEALLDAGRVSNENLNDIKAAQGFYELLLTRAGKNSENGGLAQVKLGRLALQSGEGKAAQTLFQGVLRDWSKNVALASEAQFHLGVTYETLFKNRDWATRAYDAVIASYPTSIWANDARGRLGLLVFSDTQGRRPARRVLLDIAPLPETDSANIDSLDDALKIALAARGLNADAELVRGLSLTPFYAGLNLQSPGQSVDAPFDSWQNAASAAGFLYSTQSSANDTEALKTLQDDVNASNLPLVFWNDGKNSQWALAVGYDSERGEVYLQNQGNQYQTVAVKTFAKGWKTAAPAGKPYSLILLAITGTAKTPSLTPTPLPTPVPGATPAPIIQSPPTFVWEIPRLKNLSNVYNSALKRAGLMLGRSGDQTILQGSTALDYLARNLEQASTTSSTGSTAPEAPTAAPTPTPEATPDGGMAETPVPDVTPGDESPYQPTPTPATSRPEGGGNAGADVETARRLWAFWGEASSNWASKRRAAASFCRRAYNVTNSRHFQNAANDLDSSAAAIERATQIATSLNPQNLDGKGGQLAQMAKELRVARDAERDAAHELS